MPSERSRQFLNLTTDELKSALIENAYRKNDESRRWFSRFKFASDSINGNPHIALGQGLDLLNTCKALNEDAYKEIHKGGAFYWLGIASFLVNEYEMATFFFDASVSEDLRWGDNPKINPTPAMLFMQLDGENPVQKAKKLTELAQEGIKRWVENYNNLSGVSSSPMSIQILRERLFIPSLDPERSKWRSIATTFISFCLEWDYRNALLDIRIEPGTFEPFYIHLFKGCLLFESLLKENPSPDPWKPAKEQNNNLGQVLQKYSTALGSKDNLGEKISGNLPAILADLETANNSIFTAVKFTARLRNTVGHNLGWEDGLTKIQYQKLFMMVANSCIHVIACLYK